MSKKHKPSPSAQSAMPPFLPLPLALPSRLDHPVQVDEEFETLRAGAGFFHIRFLARDVTALYIGCTDFRRAREERPRHIPEH